MPPSKIPSPTRSEASLRTSRRHKSHRTRSLGSPTSSNSSSRPPSVTKDNTKNMDVLFPSPAPSRRSVLTDNTDIVEPRRKSWWKILDESSRVVMNELLNDEEMDSSNVLKEIEIEGLSQERNNYTLSLPESSDNESIKSIIVSKKNLFTQKENHQQTKFVEVIGSRTAINKESKMKTNIDINSEIHTQELFHMTKRSKPVFPASLLNISTNKTLNNDMKVPDVPITSHKIFGNHQKKKTKNIFAAFIGSENTNESFDKTIVNKNKRNMVIEKQIKNIFGNQPESKRKKIFTEFIASESEDEKIDIHTSRAIEYKNKFDPQSKPSTSTRRHRESSPTSGYTTDMEMDDWKLLPSSTMIGDHIHDEMEIPVKKARLSNLAETKESDLGNTSTTSNKSKQSNKHSFKNKSHSSREISHIDTNISKITKSKSHINITPDKHLLLHEEQNDVNLNATENIKNQKDDLHKSKSDQTKTKSVVENVTRTDNNENDDFISDNDNVEPNNVHKAENYLSNIKHTSKNNTNNELDLHIYEINENVLQGCIDINFKPKETERAEDTVKICNVELNSSTQLLTKKINVEEVSNVTEQKSFQKNITSGNIDHHQEDVIDNIEKTITTNVTLLDQLGNEKPENEIIKHKENTQIHNEFKNNLETVNINQDIVNVSQGNFIDFEKHNDNQDEIMTTQKVVSIDKSISPEKEENSESNNKDCVDDYSNKETNNDDQEEDEESEDNQDCNSDEEVNETEQIELTNEEIEQSEEDNEMEEENSSKEKNDEYDDNHNSDQDANETEQFEQNEEDNEIEEENNSKEEAEECDDNFKSDQDANESEQIELTNEEIEQSEEDNDLEEENNSKEEISEHDDNFNSEQEANDTEQIELSNEEIEQSEEDDETEEQNSSKEKIDEYDNTVKDHAINDNQKVEIPNSKHQSPTNSKNTSPEIILRNRNKEFDFSYLTHHNTSTRKCKSMTNFPLKPSLPPVRNSTGIASGSSISEAGSGWDSHRVTRKTLRKTFGRDFSPRKSLRTLVMEKSVKRQTAALAQADKLSQAQLAETTDFNCEDNKENVSDHEASRQLRQTTIEMHFKKMAQINLEMRLRIEEEVKKSLAAVRKEPYNPFKIPEKPQFSTASKKSTQAKPKKRYNCIIPMEVLPEEVIKDMKYKPPKRFQPSNAGWITKRLYKFLESKLEPKYDYKARVRAEKLVETIYYFVTSIRRQQVAPFDAVQVLKHEMARLEVVNTHHDFFVFFHEFMPREVRVKVVPDIVNKIPLPKHGPFSEILRDD